jgi:hypothetical protein
VQQAWSKQNILVISQTGECDVFETHNFERSVAGDGAGRSPKSREHKDSSRGERHGERDLVLGTPARLLYVGKRWHDTQQKARFIIDRNGYKAVIGDPGERNTDLHGH